VIDQENGDINITKYITESGQFDVKASAQIGGRNYEQIATVSYCAAGGSTGS
jgi:hypothetical protein